MVSTRRNSSVIARDVKATDTSTVSDSWKRVPKMSKGVLCASCERVETLKGNRVGPRSSSQSPNSHLKSASQQVNHYSPGFPLARRNGAAQVSRPCRSRISTAS